MSSVLVVYRITILETDSGPDRILLHLDLPEGMWPFNGTTSARIDVAAGSAEEYCKKHFPIVEYKVIRG